MSDRRRPQDDVQFDEWLCERGENREDYLKAAGILAEFDGLAADPQAIDLLLRAPAHRPARSGARWAAGAAMAAACMAIAVGLHLAGVWPKTRETIIETPRGEQKEVVLADGSRVTLNTLSRVRIAYNFVDRRIWLEEGQADFQVAKDARRPFRVFVGQYEVRALGTSFDLRRQGAAADVALREGRLALLNGAAGRKTVVLEAGYRAELLPRGDTVIERANLQREGAWRIGRIILDGNSLVDAVQEFNRYNDQQLYLPPGAANYRVSGVFNLREPLDFVAAVAATLPVTITARESPAQPGPTPE